MYWQAPMIDRWIDHETLRNAVATAFDFVSGRIEVVDYPRTLTGPIPPEPRILLECIEREGPFPLQLNVFLGGDVLECQVSDLGGTLERARMIAQNLDAVMLFGDGPIGHDEQLRVRPDGTIDIVELDGDEMDEYRFIIVGARPFDPALLESAAEPAPTAAG